MLRGGYGRRCDGRGDGGSAKMKPQEHSIGWSTCESEGGSEAENKRCKGFLGLLRILSRRSNSQDLCTRLDIKQGMHRASYKGAVFWAWHLTRNHRGPPSRPSPPLRQVHVYKCASRQCSLAYRMMRLHCSSNWTMKHEFFPHFTGFTVKCKLTLRVAHREKEHASGSEISRSRFT